MGFFEKIKEGLKKTASSITGVFDGFSELNDDFYDELEESLILTDMGAEVAAGMIESLRSKAKAEHLKTADEAKQALREIIREALSCHKAELGLSTKPSVILVIGVNGVGKTTTIGKLAARLKADGKKVMLCAADTFRAAAADQLEIWSRRAGVDIVRQNEGADPAAVVFDAVTAAKARGTDVILCDTAGRLHNKVNLMQELGKIKRVIDRELPNADQEVLLVLDATTGQNGLIQAKAFTEAASVTGIVLTKLDGTAKGGIVVAVAKQLGIPVKYIGVGEQMDDLLPFYAETFAEALL